MEEGTEGSQTGQAGSTAGVTSTATRSPAPLAVFELPDDPDVSIVIVTYGTGGIVLDALQTLAPTLRDAELSVEVVVVDNEHPKRGHHTADRISLATHGVRLIRADGNLGFGGGNDLGVASAAADTICLLNPDVMVSAGWLTSMVATLDGSPRSVVAPRLLKPNGTLDEAGQLIDPRGMTSPVLDRITRPDYTSAACWVMRRSSYDALDGFDDRYHPAYYEDVDFAFRHQAAGGAFLVNHDVEVVHRRGGSTDVSAPDLGPVNQVFRSIWQDELDRRAADRSDHQSAQRATPPPPT